jgi:carbamoyl-phosphate synthase large subunit
VPKRTDIETVLLIGSGPIVIGQACEFDYSGTQACKALREEGYRVVLVNSNPATIMTDPGFADRTYVEPLTVDAVAAIIERERPDALLPTMGGQTALNLAVALGARGVLERHGVKLIGASLPAIEVAEDRELFRRTMASIGLDLPRSVVVSSVGEALRLVEEVGYPLILRPSFTLGGSGGSIVYNRAELDEQLLFGLRQSPRGTVLVEQSVIGWKEFELEVMRDRKDNVVVVCSIENLDPMGVHTGDSITVAPQQTLTDREYQHMRDAAIAVIRAVGVDTGGSNIQFGVDPRTGRMVVIEMNPRVSRSSALASKATGFPIAKMAARLAVGYTLDEIPNDITRKTPACFEPTIDYVVTKIPRFAFEKFRGSDHRLNTQMKSVGEVMAIGRTFRESLQKAVRSLEIDRYGFEPRLGAKPSARDLDDLRDRLRVPTPSRLWDIADAFRAGLSLEEVNARTEIDPWFLRQIGAIVALEGEAQGGGLAAAGEEGLRTLKSNGFSDRRLAELWGTAEEEVRRRRQELGVVPSFKSVDTCAAEFEAFTPYLYSTYDRESEAPPTSRPKVIILGGGPNRIGQGIEFDYCCVHASFALKEDGFETVMVNCNPETVSTDYDTSDRLYFEPLTLEDVLAVIERERPVGVIVQFGGQTPLKLAGALERCGVKILGTPHARPHPARARDRLHGRRGTGGGAPDRISGAGPPLLRARRACHGDRPRRGEPRRARCARRRGVAGAPGAHRSFPARRHRGRRRRPVRRARRGGGRDHGARRGGRRSLGRLGLRAPRLQPRAGSARGHRGRHARPRPRARRHRPHEHPARGEVGPGLRARGEPPRLADGAVRLQGHRCSARQDRRPGDGGPVARRARRA